MVFAVMNVTPGTYGKGRWAKYVEFTNFNVKNVPGIGVIMMRTNERINEVGLDDFFKILRDKTVNLVKNGQK